MLFLTDSFSRFCAFSIASAALAGCVETAPQKPSPALQRLMFACDEGDTEACKAVAADDAARRQEALILAQSMRTPPLDPTPFLRQPAPQMVYYNGPWTQCYNGTRVPQGMLCSY